MPPRLLRLAKPFIRDDWPTVTCFVIGPEPPAVHRADDNNARLALLALPWAKLKAQPSRASGAGQLGAAWHLLISILRTQLLKQLTAAGKRRSRSWLLQPTACSSLQALLPRQAFKRCYPDNSTFLSASVPASSSLSLPPSPSPPSFSLGLVLLYFFSFMPRDLYRPSCLSHHSH